MAETIKQFDTLLVQVVAYSVVALDAKEIFFFRKSYNLGNFQKFKLK